MSNSKARDLASLLSGSGTGTIAPALVSDQDNTSTGHLDLPAGTTAQRPSNPNSGYVRFNTTLDQLEQYTVDSGWQGISAPPTITTTDVTNIDESDASQVIVITGQNFDATASGSLIDGNGAAKNPTTSVRNSSSQITITYSGGDVLGASIPEPLDVKVTNGSGLSAVLENQINIDATPVWSTSAGTLATINDFATGTHATLSATDPEGETVTFSLDSGSLPGGLSLSSSGVISGDPTNVSSTTQSNFDVAASDGTGNSVNRSFSIIINPYPDGSSSARAFTSTSDLTAINASPGKYWFKCSTYNSNSPIEVSYAPYDNKGWIEVFYSARNSVSAPWDTWLSTTSGRYFMVSHGRSSFSIADHGATSGAIVLGSGFAATDFAITSKSSKTVRQVSASGQNQASALPLVKADLAGSDATALRTAMINYWLGVQGGFHAAAGDSGRDFTGGWSKAGITYLEIVLAHRNGSQSDSEWHIADGDTLDGGTYSSNIGYRNQSSYYGNHVGSWSAGTTEKSSTYDIDSGNVLSVWLTSN